MSQEQLTQPHSHKSTGSSPAYLALDSFLLDGRSRNLAPRTLEYYRQQLRWFVEFVGVDVGPRDLMATHIRSYLIHLQDRGWKATSQLAAARAIRAYCKFLVRDEWIASSPMDKVRMPKQDSEIQPAYTQGEIALLLKHARSQRDRAMIFCLLDTGSRASELLAWNNEHIDMASGAVQLTHTKGRRQRHVYLGVKARSELYKLWTEQGYVPGLPMWRSLRTGERLAYTGLAQTLHELAIASGVDATAHRFRRTFALECLRSGMNIYTLANLMGHRDIAVLRTYLALVDTDLTEAHKLHGPGDRLAR